MLIEPKRGAFRMHQPLLGNNEVNQIAFVVKDIESATKAFARLLGIEKPSWFLTEKHAISQIYFRGQPSDAQNKLVFINTPSIQIELIEPNEEPSTMREFLDHVGEGIHHVAFEIDEMKKRVQIMKEHGFAVLQTGEFTSSSGRYVYLDTQEAYKTLIELLERDEPQPITPSKPAGTPLVGSDTITQLAFVVRDIEQTAKAYSTLLGIEQPKIISAGSSDITQVEYKGQPTKADAQFAFLQTPRLEIELIQPGEAASTWRDHLYTHGEGVHHLSFVVDNLDQHIAQLQAQGYPLLQRGNFWNGQGRYAYMDTTAAYHVIIELLEKW